MYSSFIGDIHPLPFLGEATFLLPAFLYASVLLAMFGPVVFSVLREFHTGARTIPAMPSLPVPILRMAANAAFLAAVIGAVAFHEVSGPAPSPARQSSPAVALLGE